MAYRTFQVTLLSTDSTLILGKSKDRTSYRMMSTTDGALCYYGPDKTVSITTGHKLAVNVETVIDSTTGEDVRQAVYGISSADTKVVTVREDIVNPEELA